MITLEQFLTVIDAYCAATGLSETYVSRLALGSGRRIGEVRGGGDVGVRRIDEALRLLSSRWPAGVAWPADVPRPDLVTEGAGDAVA